MKITVVCDAIGAENNGAAVAAMNLIRGMKKRGHEVVAVCTDEFKKGKEGYVVVPRLSEKVRKDGADAESAGKKLLEQAVWDSDIVHVMTSSSLGHAAVQLCVRHCIPVTVDFDRQAEAVTARAGLQDSYLANALAYRYLNNRLFRYAGAVRFPNALTRGVFEKAVGHAVNGTVIPDGIGERFVPNQAQKPRAYDNRFVITYCAAYRREKAHSVLIDAVALSKNSKKIQLIFAGDGPMRRALKERSRKLTHHPIFSAFPHSQMPNVFNYSDLYVHPAQVDRQATACMEALACGKVPVIADSPQSDASRFALDERCRFVCGDARELAEKIDWFIEHPEAIEEYRERYRGIVEELSQEAYAERMEEMFFSVHG